MSVYDNNKVYLTLHSAPEDGTVQKYRLQKVSEIEVFFLHEMEESEKLAKKVRRIGNSILIADTGLIITTAITRSTLVAAFASGVVIPIGIALTGASLLLWIATTFTWKSLSAMNVKQKKHKEIRLLAQTKLESIQDIISKTASPSPVCVPLVFASLIAFSSSYFFILENTLILRYQASFTDSFVFLLLIY